MKKILLGSTVLVGAAALFAGAAFAAETPKVTLGGTSEFQVGHTSEDKDAGLRNSAFRSDNIVTVRVDGKSAAGLGYGAGVDLHADTSNDADSSYTNGGAARQTFLYVEGAQWGRVEAGSKVGADATMKVDASNIARATGGIDGDWTYFTTPTTGRVIATPDLYLNYGATQFGDRSLENSNKVSYYTPRFAGFQAGVSYSIDQNKGQDIDRTKTDYILGTAGNTTTTRAVDNIWTGGLSYQTKFSGVDIAAAATGEAGNATNATLNNLREWNVGTKLGYQGFSVAGSYGNLGDSLNLKATRSDSSTYYWTAGGAYEVGPFGASVTYLQSSVDLGATKDKFHNLSFGTDYKLAPGLTPYAELNFVDTNPTGTTQDNKATVFIAGTQLSF